MERVEERVKSEKMKDASNTTSFYEIPWAFGNQEDIEHHLSELNRRLSEHNLTASAQTIKDEADKPSKLVITLKANIHDQDQQFPVHVIEMPLNDEIHHKKITQFVINKRIDEIVSRGEKLDKCLAKLTKEKLKHDWKVAFNLKILPSAIHNVSAQIGDTIGSIIKDLIISGYQLYRLRNLKPEETPSMQRKAQELERRKSYIDNYESDLEEVMSSITNTADKQEIIRLKKEKAELQKKYIQTMLKQSGE